MEIEIVKRSNPLKGFKVPTKRRIVERTFGWLVRNRRIVRDSEVPTGHSVAMVQISMIKLMLARIARQAIFQTGTKILDTGANLAGRDSNGFTPPVMAVMSGSGGSEETRLKIVELLLDRGADPSLDCPLHIAAQTYKRALVRKLLERRANADLKDPRGRNARKRAFNKAYSFRIARPRSWIRPQFQC